MSIESNIRAVMDEVKKSRERGDQVRRLAVAAIKGGEGSDGWRSYMEMFAKSPEELSRLMASDDTKDNYEMDVARAYLIGNGPCGAETTGRLIIGVDDKLDQEL